MIGIKIIILGELRYQINEKYIVNWKSRLFKIEELGHRSFMENTDNSNWSYSDSIFEKMIEKKKTIDKITFFIINAPLEDNYYLRRIGKNACVLSLFEIAEILINNNLNIEPFIFRNIYEVVLIFKSLGTIPPAVYPIAHDDIRGCLLDMNSEFCIKINTNSSKRG